jgi:flavin prenyltransferase
LYAVDLLRTLQDTHLEIHLIVTDGAKQVIPTELDITLKDLESLAVSINPNSVVHKDADLGASIASGSFQAMGMVIVPCSAGTLAKVATGMTDNLLSRAAHVTLKERRPLILVLREAPYSRPMLQNMLSAHDAGATIVPAAPGFYHRPQSIEDLLGTITARVLDLLSIENSRTKRWKE